MTEAVAEGGCLCGAVRYRVTGAPTVSMVCHCASCARASGAPSVAWVTFPARAFRFDRGEPAAFRSSRHVVRRFCGTCGTALSYQHDERRSEIDVTTRSLDVPDAFPPSYHAWVGDGPRWSQPSDGLPAFEGAKQT